MCMSSPKMPPPPQPLPPPPEPPELRIKGNNDNEGRLRAARGRNSLRTDAPNVGLAIMPS